MVLVLLGNSEIGFPMQEDESDDGEAEEKERSFSRPFYIICQLKYVNYYTFLFAVGLQLHA